MRSLHMWSFSCLTLASCVALDLVIHLWHVVALDGVYPPILQSALLNEITFCFVGHLSSVILRGGPCDPKEGINYLHEDSFIPEVVV